MPTVMVCADSDLMHVRFRRRSGRIQVLEMLCRCAEYLLMLGKQMLGSELGFSLQSQPEWYSSLTQLSLSCLGVFAFLKAPSRLCDGHFYLGDCSIPSVKTLSSIYKFPSLVFKNPNDNLIEVTLCKTSAHPVFPAHLE